MTKTIFITGASSGIGKATAKLFATRGWKVIATMRRPEAETELNKLENLTLLPMDVTNVEQINTTVQKVLALGDVDVVFNNAGYSIIGPLEATTDEQLANQMETNFLGTVRVTRAFIPAFRERQSGLFITTSSLAGLVGFPISSMYDASKWAIEGWSESLYYELNQFGVGIKTIAPGLVSTEIGSNMVTPSHPAYETLSAKFFEAINNPQTKVSTAEDVAEVVYEAATDGKDIIRYVCGEDAKQMYAQRQQAGNEAFREGFKQMLSQF